MTNIVFFIVIIIALPYILILRRSLNLTVRLLFISCIHVFLFFFAFLLSIFIGHCSSSLSTTYVFNMIVWSAILANLLVVLFIAIKKLF
jgi:hypothetical protein